MSRLLRVGGLLALLWFLMLGHAASNAATLPEILSQLNQVRDISGISLSPDGHWLAWEQSLPRPNGQGSNGDELFVLDTRDPSSRPHKIEIPGGTPGTINERVAWSPNSTEAAFLSKAGRDGQQQILRFSPGEGAVHKLTNLQGHLDALRWSPDGSELCFLFAENGGGAGPLAAQAARVGEVDEALHNQRITVMPAGGGPIRQLSPADLNVYEYDWSRDGKSFAVIAAPGPADNNWWVAKLYTLNVSESQMRLVFQPQREQQIAIPRWSPDGSHIAFIAGLMSDQGFIGGDVFVVPESGGAASDITPSAHFSASSLVWQSDRVLLATASLEGGGAIYRLNTASKQAEQIWKGSQDVHVDGNDPDMTLSADGAQSAVVRSDWEHAPEVLLGPIGQWRQITHINQEQQAHWGKAESVSWTNGPFRAQGWLLFPENYDRSKRYPMIVSIHGGPSGQHSPAWPTAHFDMSVMSGLGYFVFFPNPRGSYGEGEAFTRANVKDFGGGDLKDILAGVDAVLKKVPVDPARIGVTGWSYGGFMTMWTVTQTNRFHAAVAGAGIANWLSYYGENSIDQWMIPFFGASVYDQPALYARSSPITYIKQVKTPTLVLVGERDAECPAPQSFEFWHALKTLGVPAKLVVYPGQGHAFDDPQDNLDRLRRSAAWFDQYLK